MPSLSSAPLYAIGLGFVSLLLYLAFPVAGRDVILFGLILMALGVFAAAALDIITRRDLTRRARSWWLIAASVGVPFFPAGALVYLFVRRGQVVAENPAPVTRIRPMRR